MSRPKDDWPYIRNQGRHFTPAEVDLIAKRFREGAKPRDVARELQCSSRNIYIRYRQLRGDGNAPSYFRNLQKVERPKRTPANREARLYRSNFEPS